MAYVHNQGWESRKLQLLLRADIRKSILELKYVCSGSVLFHQTLYSDKMCIRDRVKKVLPTDTSDLTIVDGEDYVTLVTCVPIAVNSHRLLVRGTRTE